MPYFGYTFPWIECCRQIHHQDGTMQNGAIQTNRFVHITIIYLKSDLNGTEAGLVGYWPLHKNMTDMSTYKNNVISHGNVNLVNT